MIYLMGWRLYWQYINEFNMTHEDLIEHLNRTLNLRGTITRLEILKED